VNGRSAVVVLCNPVLAVYENIDAEGAVPSTVCVVNSCSVTMVEALWLVVSISMDMISVDWRDWQIVRARW
jgi:hypothetical protein